MLPAVEESGADPVELEKQAPRSTHLAAKFVDTGDKKSEYVAIYAFVVSSSDASLIVLLCQFQDGNAQRRVRRISLASVPSVEKHI